MKGLKKHEAAAVEAFEEAGVDGAIGERPIGRYRYRKRLAGGNSRQARVTIYPFAVTAELKNWPERAMRKRDWFSLADAAKAVDETDLADVIASFQPSAQLDTRKSKRRRHIPRR